MDFTRGEAEVEVSRPGRTGARRGNGDGPAASPAERVVPQRAAETLANPAARPGLLAVEGARPGGPAVARVAGRAWRRRPRRAGDRGAAHRGRQARGPDPGPGHSGARRAAGGRSADADLKRKLLAGVAAGETILTAAIREPSQPDAGGARDGVATLLGLGGTVSGVKVGVPYAAAARLDPRSGQPGGQPADADVVAVVEPGADGLTCQRTRSSSGLPEYTLRLDRTPDRWHVLDGCTRRRPVPARRGGRVRGWRRRAGGRARPHHRARAHAASSSAGRWRRSRPWPSRSPTSTRPRGRCIWPPCRRAGGSTPGRDAGATSTSPRTGWPSTGRRRCGPAITCTAGSAWT